MKRLVMLMLLVLVLTAATPPQQQSVAYERYDVEIDLQGDSSLVVTETYRIRFEGTFQQGFAEIPLDHVEDVSDVHLWEDDREYTQGGSGPGSFVLTDEYDSLFVDWTFTPTEGSEVRTFTLQYRLAGGLWVYRDRLLLSWDAVPADRSGVPVEAARFTVHLPGPVPSVGITLEGAAARADTPDPSTVVVEAEGPVPDGTPLTVSLTLPPGLVSAETPGWQRWAGDAEYRWEAFHVDLAIAADGQLAVTEEHRLRVTDGYLYGGYREIPWRYLDSIGEMEVWEGERSLDLSDQPGDYRYVFERQYSDDPDIEYQTLTEWAVPAVGPDEIVTFTLRYTVAGVLRVMDEGQVGVWTAVFERNEPVEQATLRLYLPGGMDPATVSVEADAATAAVEPEGTLLLTHEGPVGAGEAWDVRFTLPPGATTAQKPTWQLELEQAQAEATLRAWVQLGAVVLGLLLFVGGMLAILLVWFLWGRDRPVALPADYLAEPPSDLPPGIVAYLVDEEPTVKGVLADVLHLATLGLISVDLRKRDPTVTLNWPHAVDKGDVVELGDGEEIALAEHERTLFNAVHAVLREKGKQAPLSRVMAGMRHVLGTVYEQMARQTSAFFSLRPSVARQRWLWVGLGAFIAAGGLTLLSCCLFSSSYGPAVAAPMVGLMGVGLVLMIVSRWMPRRTTKGAEEAARWRAFRRYLENLKQYGDQEAAQRILDQDLPYALALGVERVVLRQAEGLGAQAPPWLVPGEVSIGRTAVNLPTPRISLGPARGLLRGLFLSPRRLERELSRPAPHPRPRPRSHPRPGRPTIPSLDRMSEQLGGSLDQASVSLGDILDAAGGGLFSALGEILEHEASGGGKGGYRPRSGGSWRSSSWSSSRRSSRSSSWKPGRSSGRSRSSSRRSGGGRRGFG